MSDKKRSRRRKDEYVGPGDQESEKPTKQEYQIAKWLRNNVKTKKTKFLSHNVEYFTANKALDALMNSQYATGDDALFPTREHAIIQLDTMLEHKFFHRAKKVPVRINELRSGKSSNVKGKDSKEIKEAKESKDEKLTDTEKSTVEKVTDAENSHAEGRAGSQAEDVPELEKRKRKIRLDMHPEQVFVDGSDAYVWIYDPIPIHYWFYGIVLLVGAIVICMYPLWPPVLRLCVYYLSIVAAGFVGFVVALTIVRALIFTLLWVVTGGKWHFWIFPNLTNDVGFFASFWPLYDSTYNVADENKTEKSEKKSRKKKKEKDSDDGEDPIGDVPPLEPEKIEQIKENDAEMLLRRRNIGDSKAGDNSAGDHSAGEHSAGENSAGDNSGGENSGAESSDGQQDHSEHQGTPTASEESDGSEVSTKEYEIIYTSDVQNVN